MMRKRDYRGNRRQIESTDKLFISSSSSAGVLRLRPCGAWRTGARHARLLQNAGPLKFYRCLHVSIAAVWAVGGCKPAAGEWRQFEPRAGTGTGLLPLSTSAAGP